MKPKEGVIRLTAIRAEAHVTVVARAWCPKRGGGDLVRLSPRAVGSDAVTRQIVSKLN